MSLHRGLAREKRFLVVLHHSERIVEQLLAAGSISDDSLSLVGDLLLLTQHSPVLFHKHFTQLAAMERREGIAKTLNCLMHRFPHFTRLYSVADRTNDWIESHETLIKSQLVGGRGVGFTNLGNTCYFNSLIQALWLSVPFQHDVIFNKIESSVLTELRRIFLNLSYSIRPSLSPDTLFHTVRPPWFTIGSQQDSAELLRHLFDIIGSGTTASGQVRVLGEDGRDEGAVSGLMGGRLVGSREADQYKRHSLLPKPAVPLSEPSQIIQKNFQGTQQIRIECGDCEVVSSRDETFFFLSLPCNGAESISLPDLVDRTFAPETLTGENQYHCERCGGKTDATRHTHLTKLPGSLIFTLDRIAFDKEKGCRTKHLTKVTIPATIGLERSPVTGYSVVEGGDYQLYAVVVHSGSTTDSGHFYTYGLPSTSTSSLLDRSLCFNDSTVSLEDRDLINEPKMDLDTPHLLFYQRHEVHLPAQDLDLSDLTDILNQNLRVLREESGSEGSSGQGSSSGSSGSTREDKGGEGSGYNNDIMAGSSRYIF